MVSFQAPGIPQNQSKTTLDIEDFISSKKRRIEDTGDYNDLSSKNGSKLAKVENTKFLHDINFELEKPLPLEWQRCLNIKSGEIHFYNTRTHKRTSKDPRILFESERLSDHPHHMSLNLELNLGYESPAKTHIDENLKNNSNSRCENSYDQKTRNSDANLNEKAKNCGGLTSSSSWVSFEVDHREMVATVCMHCHMLVMLCKSSPSCPNCRFMHPSEQKPPTTPSLSKLFTLLC